ncbi:MAG TPA: hypothetical protein DCQ31_02340 [Bacteroidales bacterium]|nr:hypothetical protein [Bacteroidales bacterium]
MLLRSKTAKKLIQMMLGSAQEAIDDSDFLLRSGKLKAASNRIYTAIYHSIAALAIHNEDFMGNPEELFDWYLDSKSKNYMAEKRSNLVQLAEALNSADLKPGAEFDQNEIFAAIHSAKTAYEQIHEEVSKPGNLLPEYIRIIKLKNTIQQKNPGINLLSVSNLHKFTLSEICENNSKSAEAIQHFFDAPENLKNEGAFEIVIETALDKKAALNETLEDLLYDLHYELSAYFTDENMLKNTSSTETEEPEIKGEELDIHNSTSPILVPWDFTELSEFALNHANSISKITGNPVSLLHITKKTSENDAAKLKIEKYLAQKHPGKSDISILVKEGNIFTDISKEADEAKAALVIMGTHGMKGMQKFLGSWALKVIADTEAPFIIVQQPAQRAKIENVVFPITDKRDIKKIINQVRFLDKHYAPEFHLVRPEHYASDVHEKRTTSNFVFIKSYLKQNDIKFSDHKIPDTKSYYDAAQKYAEKIKPDLILILTTKDLNIQDYMLGADEQRIIANSAKLPVMCVNPLHGKWGISAMASY